MKNTAGGILAFLALIAASNAVADDCKPLTLVTSVDMTMTRDGDVFVPVTLDGVEKLMLVDTGSDVSELTKQATEELKLSKRNIGLRQFNVSGDYSDEAAHIPTLSLGPLHAENMDFMISPEKDMFDGDARIAGIIGADILQNYDVEFDFAAGKLLLFSQDHCKGKVIHWPADVVAAIPARLSGNGHITIPVTLDGNDLNAVLDTGADNSTLNLIVAESIGWKRGPADVDIGSLPGKPAARIYRHRFASLALEGISVTNPAIDVVPDLMRNQMETMSGPEIGTRLPTLGSVSRFPDLLLGMNVLRHFHLYIAYKEQMVYVTPAGAAPGAASKSQTDGPAADAH